MLRRYVWAQEEPRNMGAYSHIINAFRFEAKNLEQQVF